MADHSACFLKQHRPEIIQKTRNPIGLADALCAEDCVGNEMYEKIRKEKLEANQMREIYKCLTLTKHFECTYDWLKENEPDLLEELENKDPEAAAPQRKRSRSNTNQTVDETDNNHTGFPDLNVISTYAKLEKWVSEAKNSQKLISDLEKKIGGEGMKTLERELNDKEPKNNLCFNATSIDQIKKNKELETFLFTKSNVKFPKLTFSMFFKKRTSSKKAERSTGHDEPMDTDFNENKDNMDMQETHTDEKDGQRQSPGQPQNVSPKCPSVPITKNESPLEDTHGFMDIQENEEANVQDNAEPFCAKLLQKTSPASDSDNMPSTGSWDTQEKSEAEIKAQIKDTSMPAPEETKRTVQETDGSSMEFHTTTSGAVSDPTGKSSCSNTESALATKKRGRNKKNVLKKKIDMNNLLLSWAERQCNGCEEENPVDQISIINTAEHRDYPCLTAENVRVFKNPKSCESHIIFITDEKVSNYMLNYVMFVCDIKKAMILAPKEKEIEYDESFNINKCKRFIFEAFAPALAVFKKIQKEELYSIKNKNHFRV